MKLFNGIRNLDAFWPSEGFIWGGQKCAAGNLMLTPHPWQTALQFQLCRNNSLTGSNRCRGAESRLWRAQLWGKARLRLPERGKHNLGKTVCAEPASREWWHWQMVKGMWLQGGSAWGAPSAGMEGDAEGCVPWARHHQGFKRRSTMPEKFHHVSGISFQVTDYHCWFLALQCSSANGSIKS